MSKDILRVEDHTVGIEEKMMSLEDSARKIREDLKAADIEGDRKELERRQRIVWDEVCRWSNRLGGVTIEDYQFYQKGSGYLYGEDWATFTVEGRNFKIRYSPADMGGDWYVYLLHGGKTYSANAHLLAETLEDIRRDDEAALMVPKKAEPKKKWGRR
jgi:hypothetical protein